MSDLRKKERGKACLNCRKQLIEVDYCPECGQVNTDRDISVWTLIRDFFGDYFSFDSKLFTTMLPLVSKPGLVPKEFIEGRRVRHIPPLRSVIFSSFVFFLILGMVRAPEENSNSSIANFTAGLNQGLSGQANSDSLTLETGILNVDLTGIDSTAKDGPMGKMDQINTLVKSGMSPQAAVDSVASDNNAYQKRFFIQWGKIVAADPNTVTQYFLGNFSILILMIQPFFAFLLYLLYIRKRRVLLFIRHLVFSLYFHAWLLVLSIVVLLLSEFVFNFSPIPWVGILSLIYLLLAMKRFYEQSWAKTLLKLFFLLMLYMGLVLPSFLLVSVFTSFLFF